MPHIPPMTNMNRKHPVMKRVWGHNVEDEVFRFTECLKFFPLVAFDTEFPGVICNTYHNPNLSVQDDYIAMKGNVERTKVIQIGFTLFNAKGEIGGTWEFNFSNFGDPSDVYNPLSIEFLRRHGLDLQKIRDAGIDMYGYRFFPKIMSAFQSQKHVEFITFQGAYDFAYFLCILNNGKLPDTHVEFVSTVMKVFGQVYDTKVMANYCDGLSENLGLNKLGELLNITRVGRAHHAGSDSLMTALIFIKLKQTNEDCRFARGLIYGIGKRSLGTEPETVPTPLVEPLIPMLCPLNLAAYQLETSMFHNGYVPNYDIHGAVFFTDHSGLQWIFKDGMFAPLTQLPSTTFANPSQTSSAVDYLGPYADYYNNVNVM